MNQNPAQIDNTIPSVSSPPSILSPFKKFLPVIIIFVVLLIVVAGLLLLTSSKSVKNQPPATPTVRPTATPFPPPTIPLSTTVPTTLSASLQPVQVGRLAFIKDGDIYHSDLASISLLVKNSTAAGDKLSWSPLGNYISWRPKSVTATPSSVVVYDRFQNKQITLYTQLQENSELIDYAWSPDEKEIALLSRKNNYIISVISLLGEKQELKLIENKETAITQIIWSGEKSLLFSTDEGIFHTSSATVSSSLLISNKNVLWMKLSPDKKKILYSVGTTAKSDLFVAHTDGTNNQFIPPNPTRVTMGTTGLDQKVLKNGLLPFAIWFPTGNKLLVGYHYQPQLSLVGIYDLDENSFQAITSFVLYASDVMIDNLRLLGSRVKTTTGKSSWYLSLYTLEDDAKLGSVRIIPDASSPTFFDLYAESQ